MAIVDVTDWEMFANNDVTFRVTVKDQDGAVVNLSGYSARMEIKLDKEIATVAYISKSTTSGTQATITTPSSGIVDFFITAADFGTAPRYNLPYYYAVKIKSATNKEYTVLEGTVKFKKPVFTTVP